jgi:transcriptional regulator with XRE-family HTH domain
VDRYRTATLRQLASLAQAVREARAALGYTELHAASLSNVSLTTLRAVEAGDPEIAAGHYMDVLIGLGMTPEQVERGVDVIEDRF